MAKEVDFVVCLEMGIALGMESYGCLEPLVSDVVVVGLGSLWGPTESPAIKGTQ